MNNYLLMLRNETIDFGSYSPEDYQKILADFDKWNTEMINGERLIASGSLKDGEGKTIRTGNIVKDGPYSEAKEAVAGFIMIRAEDYDKAVEIAKGCPFLPRGGSVEVRWVQHLEFEDAAQPILDAHARARAEAGVS